MPIPPADPIAFIRTQKQCAHLRGLVRCGLPLALVALSMIRSVAQPASFAGNAQHTGNYDVAAQHLNTLRWSTSVNLSNSGVFAHYGAPVITSSNTVVVPVKTATGFQVRVVDGATGQLKYILATDYTLPTYNWVPSYQPVLASAPAGIRLYYPGAGGTIFYLENPDAITPGTPVRQCFYTDVATYAASSNSFNSSIFINTPITADTNGNVFFGFRMQGTAPAPLSTTNGGFARIDSSGGATHVLAGAAAADPLISRDSHNSAPALSNDGTTLYVVAKGTNAYYGYLLGLDSTTLATKYRVVLRDPRNGNFAGILDDSTASPVVAPDGDVYFGIISNPDNGSRGFLLRFSADLAVQKTPGGFGWDYTPAIVPSSMVPSYHGSSPYLLFAKYNNYSGSGDGNGINRIALLDPNATQIDPHATAGGLVEMREVLTVIGCTPGGGFSFNYPQAVKEWCINAAAVNPATKSIFTPSEDGRIYRWNLAVNTLSEAFATGAGVGQPYVPSVLGPDGTIYTLNGGTLFAVGSFTNLGLTISSSAPDLRGTVAGQAVTFTATVTNLNAGGPAPAGSVTFQDRTYRGATSLTNTLATNVPLINGVATVTTSSLSAGGSYPTNALGNHIVTAVYNGDANFPSANVSLVQKVHPSGTTTTITSAKGASNSVTFTATVAPGVTGYGKPTGLVTFSDGAAVIAQVPLNTNGVATYTITNYSSGSHAISAAYVSDTIFAASSANVLGTIPTLSGFTMLTNGAFQFGFSNVIGAPFSVLGAADLTTPTGNWPVLGPAVELSPGQFQFTDESTAGPTQQFYRVRSP